MALYHVVEALTVPRRDFRMAPKALRDDARYLVLVLVQIYLRQALILLSTEEMHRSAAEPEKLHRRRRQASLISLHHSSLSVVLRNARRIVQALRKRSFSSYHCWNCRVR